MICRLWPKWKVTRVKNPDGWTHELVALQGQTAIALLLSHATVSKQSALSLFHHILHINKTAKEWSGRGPRGREEKGGKKDTRKRKEEGKREKIQIDRLVAISVIVIPGGWMNVFDGHCRFRERERLKTREIGSGPRERNQCVGGI